MRYEAVGKPRFQVEDGGAAETIRIKARKQVFALLFLPVWLTIWTCGGIAAIASEMSQFNLFICFWLCGWAAGWLFAVSAIAWMLFGSETLRVVNGNLESGLCIGPWTRRKLYQGGQIRDLKASAQLAPFSGFSWGAPFSGGKFGSIQFNYGARTVRLASGLDEAEGALIVERLLRRLPASAARLSA